MLEVSPIGITLNFPLSMFVLLELSLLVELREKVFSFKSILRLSLLEFKLLLELSVLLLQLLCPFLLAQFIFFQLGKLCSRSSALRTDLQHMNAFAIRCYSYRIQSD